MKPGYKIIIAGLLIYGGFEVKAIMDVVPYKEFALKFVKFTKQQKLFQAQELLSERLQGVVSIEQIDSLVNEYNLTQLSKLEWIDWSGEDGNYTLNGYLNFKDDRRIAVEFDLYSTEENNTKIYSLKIENKDIVKIENEILNL